MAQPKTRDPIPAFDTVEEIAGFWDTHSTADYDDMTHEVHFDIAPNISECLVNGKDSAPE